MIKKTTHKPKINIMIIYYDYNDYNFYRVEIDDFQQLIDCIINKISWVSKNFHDAYDIDDNYKITIEDIDGLDVMMCDLIKFEVFEDISIQLTKMKPEYEYSLSELFKIENIVSLSLQEIYDKCNKIWGYKLSLI